ncbi:MAG: A24 family peptidase [Syntrophomonadaceae bacterium]
MMEMAAWGAAGLAGLLAGSFLNVAISRLPSGQSVVSPGSHCPRCKHRLGALDLIPLLGYMLRRGRCHYCQEPILPRYPLVEILASLGFMAVAEISTFSGSMVSGWIFTAVLITASFTDLETGLIPNQLTYPGIIAGILLSAKTVGFGDSLSGSICFAGLLWAAAVLSKGGMGGGDIKLAAVIGTFLGAEGSGITLMLASLAGSVKATHLLVTGRCNRKTSLPFGPYLAGSAWVVWMWGDRLLELYMAIISSISGF